MNINMDTKFEKSYKLLPEIIRRQIKKNIRLLANDPGNKVLNTKFYDSKTQIYESTITLNCKIIWKFKTNEQKDIILLNIESIDGCCKTLEKLSEIDEIIEKTKNNY